MGFLVLAGGNAQLGFVVVVFVAVAL